MASPLSNGTSQPEHTARLMCPTAFDAFAGGTNCAAYAMTSSQKVSFGST